MPLSLIDRLRNSQQLTVVSAVGVLLAATILPFAVFRFWNGQYLIGLVDSLIIISISWVVVRSWRSESIGSAGLTLAIVTTISCALVSIVLARHGLLWAYVVFATNFMLTERRYALVANIALLLTLGLHSEVFDTVQERLVFIVTGTMVSAAAFISAYHNAMQRQQLVALASRDALTGLRNRLVMQTDLALAVETHRNSAAPCGIAMLDLDRFKRVNDQFGHEAGDHVLVDFARIAESHCRKSDRLYRFGGEEFVVLLPNTPADGLRAALENIRAAVEDSLKAPDGSAVTVSAGGAIMRGEADWTDWLARADAALYRAKGRGRNAVVLDDDAFGQNEPTDLERRASPS